MNNKWVDRVKATIGVEAAAAALGLRRGRGPSLGPCPLCHAETRGAGDQRLPLGVGKEKGRWQCWRCNEGGDVLDLVAAVRLGTRTDGLDPGRWAEVRAACSALGWVEGDQRSERVPKPGAAAGRIVNVRGARSERTAPEPAPESGGSATWSETLAPESAARLRRPEGAAALEYLRAVRRFSDATIDAWGLGATVARDGSSWVTIPLRNARDEVVNVRFRSVPPSCPGRPGGLAGCDRCDACRKAKGYRVCKGRPLPLFGSQRLSNDFETPVILTEGELDTIALWEYGYTVGVVSGTAGATALKDEWLDLLEPYSGFILAFDNDKKGEEGATQFAERIGRYRCSRVTLPRKDAGECLADEVAGEVVETAINRSRAMLSTDIVSVGEFADDIERIVSRPADLIGRPTGSRKLDRALGGLRPGLIIVTGETGSGKTTFTTWLLAEQARAGVPALLTSFEQSPIGTVQKLLRAELGGDFTNRTEGERRSAMAAIDSRPISIVRHRGQMPFDELHDIIRFAVRRLGVRSVLVDHLGFVLNPEADDERREIETVVRALSIIAEHEGVTIILVCHPSNQYVQQRRRVGIADLKGASALRQDAHEVWVVETAKPTTKRPWPGTWVHLDKIRSDFGSSGSAVLLAFDPLACSYADSWDETPSGKRGVRVVVPSGKPKGVPSGRKGKGKDAAAGAAETDDEAADDADDGDDQGAGRAAERS